MSSLSSKRTSLPVNGVLLLDKPVGFTSNHALLRAKRIVRAKKAGHTGTLDPFATGLLPLCFGEATKFSQDLLNADKTYEAVIHLGVTTSTGDTEGEILDRKETDAITLKQVEQVLSRFKGEIQQIPPMYSALKRDGKPLYEYARAGIELEREARSVTIHELELLNYQAPFASIRVSCSKGTYIRVLGEDIGQTLECGAHLQSLRRIKVGDLTIGTAHTLQSLEQLPAEKLAEVLQPLDCLLSSFPEVLLSSDLAKRFMHGQRLALEKEKIQVSKESDRVRVYCNSTGLLLGTGILRAGQILAPERLIANQTN